MLTRLGKRGRSKGATPVTFWQRHTGMLFRYGSPRKWLNLARAALHYVRGSAEIPTMPAFLKVEISRKCEVHCRYCFEPKDSVFYPLDAYKAMIDRMKRHVFEVSLYEIGEPLLNEHVLDYVRYAHDRGIGTVISTSLSVRKPEGFWAELARSGLDLLIAAIDGVTGEVYNQYRTHGDLDLVMSNLRAVLRHRLACRSRLKVEWQMIDLPWNRQEQGMARDLARQLGCDEFRLIPEAVLPRRQYSAQAVPRGRNCLLPYVVLIVSAYNKVTPCFKFASPDMVVGNLAGQTVEEVWNGPEIGRIRDPRLIASRPTCCTCQE